MGLTSSGSYTGGSRKYLNLNTKNVPVFIWKPKDGEMQTFSKVEGDFVSCSFFDNEYEGEVTRKMDLILRDGDEDYYIQSSLSATCRSILNTLASCEDGVGRVAISVYEKESSQEERDATKWLDSVIIWSIDSKWFSVFVVFARCGKIFLLLWMSCCNTNLVRF